MTFKKGEAPPNTGRTHFKKGFTPWNKGLNGYRAGEKHPWMPKGKDHYNWKGGISNNPYTQDWTVKFLNSIRERDDLICQECGIHQDELTGRFKKLDVHHIDYDKNNCNPDNLISLCRSCHMKTNYNRDYWIEYFKI